MPSVDWMTGEPELPLRMRRRRDGTMVVTDHMSVVLGAGSEYPAFPPVYTFNWDWLNGTDGSKVARVKRDDEGAPIGVSLVFANATASYDVTGQILKDGNPRSLSAALTSFELLDPPPVDNKIAAKRAKEYAARDRKAATEAAKALLTEAGYEITGGTK